MSDNINPSRLKRVYNARLNAKDLSFARTGKACSDLEKKISVQTQNVASLEKSLKSLTEKALNLQRQISSMTSQESEKSNNQFDASNSSSDSRGVLDAAESELYEIREVRSKILQQRLRNAKRALEQSKSELAEQKAQLRKTVKNRQARYRKPNSTAVSERAKEEGRRTLKQDYRKDIIQNSTPKTSAEVVNVPEPSKKVGLSRSQRLKANKVTGNGSPSRMKSRKLTEQTRKRRAPNLANKSMTASKGSKIGSKTVATGVSKGAAEVATKTGSAAAKEAGKKAAIKAAATGSKAASGPVGWILLAVDLAKPPKAKQMTGDRAQDVNSGFSNVSKFGRWVTRLVLPFMGLAMPVVFIFFIIILIVILLFQLQPIEAQYSLRDSVFLVEQEYHSQLATKAHDLFDTGEENLYYTNNSLSWKNMLCYWYVISLEDDAFMFKNVNPDDVKSLVNDSLLRPEDTQNLTYTFNTLNTILVYPNDEVYEEFICDITSLPAEKQKPEALDAEYGVGNWVIKNATQLFVQHTSKKCYVDVDSKTAYEASSELSEEQQKHIDLCLRAISEDNRELEPVFYEIWQAITEATHVNDTARDQLVKEAYALWLISGGASDYCGNEYIPGRDYFTDLSYTFYRETTSGSVSTFDFDYSAIDGHNTSANLAQYGLVPQSDTTAPIFLKRENGEGLTCKDGVSTFDIPEKEDTNGDGKIDDNDIDPLPELRFEDYGWCAYSWYIATGTNYGAKISNAGGMPWCMVFVNSMAQNYYRRGCFFSERSYFIDKNHPGWTAFEEDQDYEAASADLHMKFLSLLNAVRSKNILDVLAAYKNCTDSFWEYVDEFADESFINSLHLTATTKYYRMNLMQWSSMLPYGIEHDYTKKNALGSRPRFSPALEDDPDNYAPDPDYTYATSFKTLTYSESSNSVVVDHVGHKRGWYAPIWETVSCRLFENESDLTEAYNEIAMYRLIMHKVFEYKKTNGQAGVDDLISLLDSALNGTDNNYIVSMNELMDSDCAIFGELQEENQGLFPSGENNWTTTTCDAYKEEFARKTPSVDVYEKDSFELYTPQPGDVVLFDWVGRDTGWVCDHVGLVVWVSDDGNSLAIIEGNKGAKVGMRFIKKTNENVNCYCHPKYGAED